MPEGPEIYLAAKFINSIAKNNAFFGAVVKSAVSIKNPDLNFSSEQYKITAQSRGKELKLFLHDMNESSSSSESKNTDKMILLHFGMTGGFVFTPATEIPKHAHLQFFSQNGVLCFVDSRRFGRWLINCDWGPDRGPDPINEYNEFHQNITNNLSDKEFNRPICEVMLNQRYFNGIGNYLRAEILYRAGIPPFLEARSALSSSSNSPQMVNGVISTDIISLCHLLPMEVVSLDGLKGYNVDRGRKSNMAEFRPFLDWLQCYSKDGMKTLVDSNGRRIWFNGYAGPMATDKNFVKQKSRKTIIKATKIETNIMFKSEFKEEEHLPVKSDISLRPKTKTKNCVKRRSPRLEKITPP